MSSPKGRRGGVSGAVEMLKGGRRNSGATASMTSGLSLDDRLSAGLKERRGSLGKERRGSFDLQAALGRERRGSFDLQAALLEKEASEIPSPKPPAMLTKRGSLKWGDIDPDAVAQEADEQLRRGTVVPSAMRPSQRHLVSGDTEDDFKEVVDNVQKRAPFFRGFDAEEIDYLVEYFSEVKFNNGDLIAANGEQASWCGILLSGQVDAVTSSGTVLGSLAAGSILGEMALFRGGKRMADMVAKGSGTLAALLFDDIPTMYANNPRATHKLMLAFAKAGAAKLMLPHPFPSASTADQSPKPARRSNDGKDEMFRHTVAQQALEKRGLDHRETTKLLGSLDVLEFSPGQVVFQRGRLLTHIGIVLQGSVIDGGHERGVGELVGEWWAVSGHPVAHNVVGGAAGCSMGCVSLDWVGEAGEKDAELAIKVIKLIGIGATLSEGERNKGAVSLAVSAGTSSQNKLQKQKEVLYRNMLKENEATLEMAERKAEKARQEKHRNELLYQKLQRDYDQQYSLLEECIAEMRHGKHEIAQLKKLVDKQQWEITGQSNKLLEMKKTIDMASDESRQMREIERLHDDVTSRQAEIERLQSELETAGQEADEAAEGFRAEMDERLSEQRQERQGLVARWRWKWSLASVVLELKRRGERQMRARAIIIEWLSQRDGAEASLKMDKMAIELNQQAKQLAQTEVEREAHRMAAAAIAEAKSELESKQASLLATAKDAIIRDQSRETWYREAEVREAATVARADKLHDEIHHLKWLAKQADEARAAEADVAASAVRARDRALRAVEESRKEQREAEEGRKAAEEALKQVEAPIMGLKASHAARSAEAKEARRERSSNLARIETLEQQLHDAEAALVSESMHRKKFDEVLCRLFELEDSFGDMLPPRSEKSGSYLGALHGLTRPEISPQTTPYHFVTQSDPSSNSMIPLKALTAAEASSNSAQARSDDVLQDTIPAIALHKHHRSLRQSSSLPVIRAPSLGARSPPIARGAIRVSARQGVSLGHRKEQRSSIIRGARASPMGRCDGASQTSPLLQDGNKPELPPELPVVPVGGLYQPPSHAPPCLA